MKCLDCTEAIPTTPLPYRIPLTLVGLADQAVGKPVAAPPPLCRSCYVKREGGDGALDAYGDLSGLGDDDCRQYIVEDRRSKRTLRRTIDILPGRETFWHDRYPKPPAPVSRCTSRRPQRVCTCGEYSLKWVGQAVIPLTALRATAVHLLAPTPMPRCHCGQAVGGPNSVRGKVGPIITGCATCTPERRR